MSIILVIIVIFVSIPFVIVFFYNPWIGAGAVMLIAVTHQIHLFRKRRRAARNQATAAKWQKKV